jgi:acetyltransferase-like isoleucine patch superfamily enzyme
LITLIKFYGNGVVFKNFISRGIPEINVNLKGSLCIGKDFVMHNGKNFNTIGRQQPCYLVVGKNAKLDIGNNVGLSCTAIICYSSISIGNDVKVGGNVVIYDSDFHSLNHLERNADPEIKVNVRTKPVFIEEGVFVGAHTTILKGVRIGKNAVVGAGSVVSKDIPANQVWAGNPAKFIKEL